MNGGLPAPVWLSLALLGGSAAFDGHLADYRWDVTPRASWGARALVGRGAFAAGLRATGARTTQGIGVPDPSSAANVSFTTLEGIGEARLASAAGFEIAGLASGGWMRIGYRPDRVAVPTGGGPDLEVRLDPVQTWIAGAGFAVRRPVAGPWSAGLALERCAFRLRTAHRAGAEIVTTHETFGDWSGRLELARRFGRT